MLRVLILEFLSVVDQTRLLNLAIVCVTEQQRKIIPHVVVCVTEQKNTLFQFSSLVYGLCANLYFLIHRILEFQDFFLFALNPLEIHVFPSNFGIPPLPGIPTTFTLPPWVFFRIGSILQDLDKYKIYLMNLSEDWTFLWYKIFVPKKRR